MTNALHGRFADMMDAVLSPVPPARLRCLDLFCGIGGFHVAARNLGLEVVFACDIDDEARKAYQSNYGLAPHGDITKVSPDDVPPFDLLLAGFPCQPFSIIGSKHGFADPRGELFFETLRFLRARRPAGVILENVKQLATADHGRVLGRIQADLEALGYHVESAILNALDFGLPQKRERTIVVGTLKRVPFPWPTETVPMRPLAEVLEPSPDPRVFVSDEIREKRKRMHTAPYSPMIWHENKAGNISSHPFSCALRAGASHNYLLVDGERRLTGREMLRLQGFPEDWKIVCNEAQTRKQAGNAVPVPVVQAVMERMLHVIRPSSPRQSTAQLRSLPARTDTGQRTA